MEIRRKTAMMFFVLAVILIVMVGCSKSSKNDQAAEQTNTPEPAATSAPASASTPAPASASAADGSPMVISWLSEDPPKDEEMIAQKYLETKFNVKFNNIKIDTSVYREKLNLLLSSGTIPDVMWGRFDFQGLYQQGVLAEIPTDEIRQYMPNYAKSIDDVDSALWKEYSFDGKNYGIPLYNVYGNVPRLPLYRLDWLKNIGYDHAPKTIQEMEDVFTKFTKDDPDRDGKNDTFGLSARGKDALARSFSIVFGQFGIQPYYWEKTSDGKLQFSMITEQARQGFEVLNRWYKNGLIDPEFAVHDAKSFENEFLQSKVGVLQGQVLTQAVPSAVKKWRSALFDAVPTAETVAGPVVGGYTEGFRNSPVVFGIQMQKDAAKRQKVYQILEAMATDPEVHIKTFFGNEGEDYDIVDGGIVPKDAYVDSGIRGPEIGAGAFYNVFGDFSSPVVMSHYETKEFTDFREDVMKNSTAILNAVDFPIPAAANYPDLQKIQDQYFVKFITGEVDLGKGFDDFVQLWKKSGGQAITDNVNQVYQDMMK